MTDTDRDTIIELLDKLISVAWHRGSLVYGLPEAIEKATKQVDDTKAEVLKAIDDAILFNLEA